MNDAITIDCPTTTGGKVISGNSGVKINGKDIALVGDIATCACGSKGCRGQGPIVRKTPRDVSLLGQDFARAGDLVDTGCGTCFLLPGPHQVTLGTAMGRPVIMGKGVHIGNNVHINVGAGSSPPPSSPPERRLPSYLTGGSSQEQTASTYPVYQNTRSFPDQRVRDILEDNHVEVLLLTLPEAFAYLQSEGWNATKETWVEVTSSDFGKVMVKYGVNIKDVVTTSMVAAQFRSLGIKATVVKNHLGNEIITLTGRTDVRKILNAPRYRLDNPKIVAVGIGKYGLKNVIKSGARLSIYVSAAYNTVDFILNDKTTLSKFIGHLATDVVKMSIATSAAFAAGAGIASLTSFVLAPLVAVVFVGLVATLILNEVDEGLGITDTISSYIEQAQQDVIEKAKEISDGVWDLGGMMAAGLLKKGRDIIVSEFKMYLRNSVRDIRPRRIL